MSSIPPVSSGGPADHSAAFRGWWIPGVSLASYALGGGVAVWIHSAVETMTHRSPGLGAWYFVQEDFIQGGCMLVCLVLALALAAAFWRRYPLMARVPLALQFFTVPSVVMAAIIGLKTHHLFEPALSTSPWPTTEAYLAFKGTMFGASMLSWGLVITVLFLRALRSVQPPPA